jgi:hypothetical protein
MDVAANSYLAGNLRMGEDEDAYQLLLTSDNNAAPSG